MFVGKWVLILTLLSNGATVAQVPGFLAYGDCVNAGDLWKVNLKTELGSQSGMYICVPYEANQYRAAPQAQK